MNILTEDKKIVEKSYTKLLENLKDFIDKNEVPDAITLFFIFRKLLENKKFSDLEEEEYLYLSGINKDAAQVMAGVYQPLTLNAFLNDTLNIVGYSSSLQFVFIDENNDWTLLPNGVNANYMVVSLQEENRKIIMDAYHGGCFTMDPYGTMISAGSKDYKKTVHDNYQKEKEAIGNISKVYQKYRRLDHLGVCHVYEDEKYGL